MRKVLAVTGIRSDYFFTRPVYQKMQQSDAIDLGLVVGGAHLTDMHNYSVREIEQDGVNIIAKIDTLLYSDRLGSRLKGSINQLQILVHVIESFKPDLLFAVADREEPMMTALCGAYLNIPVIHYCAGDRGTGNIDATVRQSVSDLSHVLLTTCEDSSERLIRRGEEPWRVHNVGFSGLDRGIDTVSLELAEMAAQLELPVDKLASDYMLVIQHPISSQVERAHEQMETTLRALQQFGDVSFIVINPNSDAGNSEIRKVIKKYSERDNIFSFDNLPDELFVNLLRQAKGLVGNSSMGIYEAPFYNLPALNIGRRQIDRFHGENVTYVDNDEQQILEAIDKILEMDSPQFVSPFGDGRAAERIIDVIQNLVIDEKLLNKRLTY